MSKEILSVVSKEPDVLAIHDNKLAAKLEGLTTKSEFTDAPVLPMSKISMAKEHLATVVGKVPWLEAALDDAAWAWNNKWLIQPEPIAWLVDEYLILQVPYALTLSDKINDLGCDYYYSRGLEGWVIDLDKVDVDAMSAIVSAYGVTPSVNVADHLEGRIGWKNKIAELVASALAEGFLPPDKDLFVTNREYKPWQKDSVLAMAYQGTNLLTDQVGLGKGGSFVGTTLVLNQFINKGKITPGGFPVVIAVTKSMKDEIGEEVMKWWDAAQVEIISGTKSAPITKGKDFYIINHDIIAARVDDLIDLAPVGFIADECHVYKNDDSKRTQAAQKLAKYIRTSADERGEEPFIIMASGTPFLNAPIELWSLLIILGIDHIFSKFARMRLDRTTMQIKNPRFDWKRQPGAKNPKLIEVPLSDKGAFEYYFCNAGFDKFGQWQNKGSAHVKELHKLLIDTGMIRRRKSDVMHPLPPLSESVVKLDMSEDDWEEYEKVDEEFRDWAVEEAKVFAKAEGTSIDVAIKQVLRKLDNGEGMMRLTAVRQKLAMGKVDGTVDWIHKFMAGDPSVVGDDAEGRKKVIVFVHHQEPRRMLIEHPELQQYGILTILPGQEQNGESIQEHKRQFQKDDRFRLMICSMAAREGHTLTAAKDVYLHEIPFVPSWVVQMAGRCWARLSEDFVPHEAFIHYAVVDGTEDPRLLQMNRIKKATFNAVIDGEGQDETISDIKEESVDTLIRALSLRTKEIGVAA